MSWATTFITLGSFAAGLACSAGWYERAARIEAERQLTVAVEQPAKQIADERRLVAATDARDRGKERARAGVSAAPALADVPLPDDLASMLMAQAEATRSAARGKVPDRPVP